MRNEEFRHALHADRNFTHIITLLRICFVTAVLQYCTNMMIRIMSAKRTR